VRLRLSVDEDGQVVGAAVARSSGDRALDAAAADAAGRWEYDPAIRDGRGVPGVVYEEVRFAAR
jgi:protein TonB